MILVIFLEEVGELCHFFAFLAAGNHLDAVRLEPNDLVGCLIIILATHHVALETILVRRKLLAQLLAAQLVVAFHEGALAFVVLYFLNREGDAADAACYLVLGVDLHDYL